MDAEAVVQMARAFYDEGYRTFRLKLGRGISEDVETVKLMRRTLGEKILIRVDYNQAYRHAPLAIRAIKANGTVLLLCIKENDQSGLKT